MSASARAIQQSARVKAGSRPKLREITADDFPAIASFTKSFGFEPLRSRAEWDHLWLDNPAHIATGMRCPRGWILESDGRMVGHIANIPTLYRFGDRQLLCASGRAWAVIEEYRGYSPLMLHQYHEQSGVDFTLTNTANELSYRVHRELGADAVPLGRWDLSRSWVTGYSEMLADLLARKNVRIPQPLLLPAAAFLAAKDIPACVRLKARSRGNLDIECAFAFDERFDDFWKQLCDRYPNKLLAQRNLQTLQWHFHSAMAESRFFVLTAARNHELLAYAVLVLDSYKIPGSAIHRAVVADYQSLEADDGIYFALLRRALEQCRATGISLLVANGFSASGTDMSRMAPYRRALPNPRFLYKSAEPQLAMLLADPGVWCPSAYDADDTL